MLWLIASVYSLITNFLCGGLSFTTTRLIGLTFMMTLLHGMFELKHGIRLREKCLQWGFQWWMPPPSPTPAPTDSELKRKWGEISEETSVPAKKVEQGNGKISGRNQWFMWWYRQSHIKKMSTSRDIFHHHALPTVLLDPDLKMILFYSVIWKLGGIVVIELTDVQLLSEIC